ncbi:hypothetical protein Csa_023955, partial [Cucumis sativus]
QWLPEVILVHNFLRFLLQLEWGMGLAKNREVEAELMELELEKDRPFARSSPRTPNPEPRTPKPQT